MSDVLTSVLAVFTAMAEWFGSAFDAVIPIFWTAASSGGTGSLTFIGVLAVAGLAVAVTLLLLRWVTNFLQFRG